MIDYEKLKIAHELIDKLRPVAYELMYKMVEDEIQYWRFNYCLTFNWIDNSFDSIDDLVAKLLELAKPEPKYKAGDTVFAVSYPDITEGKIINFDGKHYYVRFIDDGYKAYFSEFLLHDSRETLIQAQIDYWQKLKQEHCEHSYDTVRYSITDKATLSIQCCSKCGEDKPDDTMAFEGPIQGFNDHQEDIIKNQFGHPQMFETTCCGKKFYYTNLFGTTNPKCHVCGKDLLQQEIETCTQNDEKSTDCDDASMQSTCQHEDDGKEFNHVRFGGVPHMRCRKCGDYYHQKSGYTYFEQCQHESDGDVMDNSGTFKLGCFKCIKCGEFYK
jgi:hypothetical protein